MKTANYLPLIIDGYFAVALVTGLYFLWSDVIGVTLKRLIGRSDLINVPPTKYLV